MAGQTTKNKRGRPPTVTNSDGDVVGFRNLSRNSKNNYKHNRDSSEGLGYFIQ